MTSVVSGTNAPRMAIEEARSGVLLDGTQIQKEIRQLVRNPPRLAETPNSVREASRLQLEKEEKQDGKRCESLPS